MKCFVWEGHGNAVLKKVSELYKHGANTDCIFTVEGCKVRVHKIILIACSNYFQEILKNKSGEEEIVLENVKICDFKSVLDFLYFGNVEIPENQLASFKSTVELLEIKELQGALELQNITKLEPERDAVPISSDDFAIEKKSEIEEFGIVFEAINTKKIITKEEVNNTEGCMSDKDLYADAHFHSEVDLKTENEDFQKPMYLFCNENVVEDGSVDVNKDPLSISDVDIKIEKELKCMGGCHISCCDLEISANESAVERKNVDCCEDPLSLSNPNIKVEGEIMKIEKEDSARELHTPLCRQEENNKVREAVRESQTSNHRSSKETAFGSYCSYSTSSKNALRGDLSTHTEERPSAPFSCTEYSKTASYQSNLPTRQGIPTVDRPYKCNVCSSSFSRSHTLKIHKRTHTGEKPYACDVCSSSFAELSNLTRHKRIHTGEKPYLCDICSSSFAQLGHLKIHKRTHSGDKPYSCDICSSAFSQMADLKTHKRTHTGEKPYVCDICPSSFSQSGSLKIHKRIHSGEKPFVCDICPSSFTVLSNLTRHKLTHSGEKPYACDICSSSFAVHDTLKAHKRTHTCEKPYACDSCTSSFAQLSSLKAHKRIHSGEKPYVCDICSSSFTRSNSLKKHNLSHSGETPFRCGFSHHLSASTMKNNL